MRQSKGVVGNVGYNPQQLTYVGRIFSKPSRPIPILADFLSDAKRIWCLKFLNNPLVN